jgi:hypothetical protein
VLVVLSGVKVCSCSLAKFSKGEFLASEMLIVVRLCLASQHGAKGSRILLCGNASLCTKVVEDVELKVEDVVEIASEPKLIVV